MKQQKTVAATKHRRDATAYARANGYRGERPVIVSDGRVISHRNMDWARFMAKVRLGRL